jgi:hypothetical protein
VFPMWRRHLRAQSSGQRRRTVAEEKPMFPFNSPELQLELARLHAADVRREVAAARHGRSGSAGRHARPGRRARASRHAPAAAAG